MTTYACLLTGGVTVEHLRGDVRVGGLQADRLRLLFDVDDRAGERFARTPESSREESAPTVAEAPAAAPPASAPASAARPAERLVIYWSGPLELAPLSGQAPRRTPRRRLEALGGDILLTSRDGTVRCGRLAYDEADKRLWLYARDDGQVAFDVGQRLTVRAAGVYVDQRERLVKLVGPVRLETGNARRAGGQRMKITCTVGAELHLAAGGQAPEGVGPDLSADLESARFLGQVQVRLEDRTLTADELVARFRRVPAPRDTSGLQKPEGSTGASDLTLEQAIASGEVELRRGEQRLTCAWARMDFSTSEQGRLVPVRLDARGAVALEDAPEQLAARGRQLVAGFGPEGRIRQAHVQGSDAHPAWVYARQYSVTGRDIRFDLDEPLESERGSRNPEFRMRVPGPARLVFWSDRSLRGRRRGRPVPIRVTCSKMLDVDARRGENAVRFRGRVVARTGHEQLEADSMTLLLQDVPVQEAKRRGAALAGALLSPLLPERAVRTLLAGVVAGRRFVALAGATLDGLRSGRPPTWLTGGTGRSEKPTRTRKEPFRLIAKNALIISEEFAPDDERPVVSQTLSAPELVVQVRERTIRTIGETILGMTSRQMPTGQATPRNTLGVPSALLSRGPSQTALMCTDSMTYILGEEGDARRDSVLFEGNVRFRHVAGRQLHNLDELLPDVARNPDLLQLLDDRNVYLECGRLELILSVSGQGADAYDSPASRGVRVVWLNATQNVYLRDQQGAGVREVYAEQIDFDRNAARVRVFGDPARNVPARVLYENKVTGRFDRPAIGPAFTVFLDTNTVRASAITGEFRP